MDKTPQFIGLYISFAFAVLLLIVGLVVGAYFYAGNRPELIIGLMVILGVSVLGVLLFIMAAGFAALRLHDNRQAMGLPQGSIRALIALFLIVVWIILSVFLFNAAQSPGSSNAQIIQLSQQLFTTLGTLVVAIAAFYFGSANVEAAVRSAIATSTTGERPTIQSISPVTGEQGQELEITITGKSFRLPEVRLIQGNEQMEGTDILSSATQIKCKVTIPANQKLGKWDVIVVNEDGRQHQLREVFEVTEVKKGATSQP